MELLFISHKYPPATGGMEKQSYELIQGMEKYARVHKIVYEGKGNRLGFFLSLNRKIKQKLKQNPKIQAIHLNDGLLATICSFHSGYEHIPVSATIHGLEISFPNTFYKKHLLSRLNRFHKIIAVSQATANEAINNGLLKEKVVVIPNGVDISEEIRTSKEEFQKLRVEFGLSEKKILMLLGRPVKRKGFSWFIKNVLPNLNQDFQVVIAGPFNHKPTLTENLLGFLPHKLSHQVMLFLGYPSDEAELRKILKTNTDVSHLGLLPYRIIQSFFKHSAAFIMPNIKVKGDMEGFGLVCLEASVNGALVLAANLDGIPSAIQHHKNGILIESGNIDDWINTLKSIGETTTKNEIFRNYTLQNYSWDKMVKGYVSVLNKEVYC